MRHDVCVYKTKNKTKVIRTGYMAAQGPIMVEEVNQFTYLAASLQATEMLNTTLCVECSLPALLADLVDPKD